MGHAMRGAVTAWLALIVLQTIGSSGSGRIAGLFSDIDALVKRALDPSVPAIPDLSAGGAWGGGATPIVGPGTPFTTGLSPAVAPEAHAGAQYNPSTGQAVGFGY